MVRARWLTAVLAVLLLAGCDELKIKSDGDAKEFRYGSPVHLWLARKDTPVSSIAGIGSATIEWTSSRDGALGSGTDLTTSALSAGEHKIEVRGTFAGKTEDCSRKVEILNDAPVAKIVEPALRTFGVGTEIRFAGQAADREDGAVDAARLSWKVNGAARGDGATLAIRDLLPGKHKVALQAVDRAGARASATIDVEITNRPPAVTIDSPAASIKVKAYEAVVLKGHATDPDPLAGTADVPASRLRWSSSLSGFLGQGAELSFSELQGGEHVIELRATDEFGAEARATVRVEVKNEAPKVKIESPGNHSYYSVNQEVRFFARVSDEEDGSIADDRVVWRSDQDGELGRGTTLKTKKLRPGVHQVTCTAKDRLGGTGSARVEVLIRNETPTASIARPSDGTALGFNETIELAGSGSDPEDGDLDGPSLTWTFNGGTRIGFGKRVSVTGRDLGFGTHTLSLVATDSSGAKSAAATRTVTVKNAAPEVKIVSPADGASVNAGPIQLAGVARDPDRDSWITGGVLSWTSTQGTMTRAIGTGDRPIATLEVGVHVITLTVRDPDDASIQGQARITLTVVASGTPTPAPTTTPTGGITGAIPGP